MRRKLEAIQREVGKTIEYLDAAQGFYQAKEAIVDEKLVLKDSQLDVFLSEQISENVLDEEAQMVYWSKKTGVPIEELAKKKKEAVYAALRARHDNPKKED